MNIPTIGMPPGVPQQEFTLSDTTEVKCLCGNKLLQEGIILRRLSKLRTGKQQDTIWQVPVFYCLKCGEILQEFVPNDLKDPKIV